MSGVEKRFCVSKKMIFDNTYIKKVDMTSQIDFFDKFFQISGHDGQSKKCGANSEQSIEWLIGSNSEDFSCQKIATILG